MSRRFVLALAVVGIVTLSLVWSHAAILSAAKNLNAEMLRFAQEVPLGYAGVESTYSGELRMPFSGSYTLEVLAMEPRNANFGRAERALTVAR